MRFWPIFRFVIWCAGSGPYLATAGELHQAASNGDTDRVAALIEAGANVDALDSAGATALFEASKMGRAEAVEMLLEAGADPLIAVPGPLGSIGTAIHVAAGRGHVSVLRVLLDAGVDPNLANDGTGPPLHNAPARNHVGAENLLMSFGAMATGEEQITGLIRVADAGLGREVANTCLACHWNAPSDPPRRMEGPSLWSILSRPKASVEGYDYSKAMRAMPGTWDYEALNSFLANPRGFVPGTKMAAFAGIMVPERRAALIAYLRILSDHPVALP